MAKFKGRRRRRRRRRTVGGDARGKGRKKVFFLGRDFEDKTRIQAEGKAGDHSSKKLPKKPQNVTINTLLRRIRLCLPIPFRMRMLTT